MNEFVTIFSVELMRRLRSRAFVIGLLIGVVSIVIIVKLPEWLSGAFMSQKNVIVAGPPALTAPAARLLAKDFTVVGTQADSGTPPAKLLQQRKASVVALRTEGRKLSVTVYSTDPANFRDKAVAQDLAPLSVGTGISMSQSQIEKYLNVPVMVRGVGSKFENAEAANAAQGLAMTLLFLLYLATLINSQMLTTSIAEEKTNRIAELLVACVNPSNLLAAKIAVVGVLGLIQAACWAASAFLAGTLGVQAGSGA
ncbi:MAG: ABC transporter permease, partial [Candidatus Eremiobacteraeota bacterium]|nr:ABC transporter permease [Candidatus Eremiobacteraeota bacterium]